MTKRIPLIILIAIGTIFFEAGRANATERPFEGLKALVVEPENFWGWDAVVFGALQERYFDVTYAKPEVLQDFDFLSQFDLVASNIRRGFTPAQVENLKKFIAEGGAFYGSWGGPMSTPELLRVCHVANTKSVYISGMTLLESPLSEGIDEKDRYIQFPEVVGHARGNWIWERVVTTPLEGGIPVAKDAAGNILGALGEYGKGRTAVLGFGPENNKYFTKRGIGPIMLDNLLNWLLQEKLRSGKRTWSWTVEVSLPVRAEVTAVYMNGKRIGNIKVREEGSLKKIEVSVKGVAEGKEATIRLTYKPLTEGRNIETVIHMPWRSFGFFISNQNGTPAKLAKWLKSVHATVCQPLLRESNGFAYYQGMPEDTIDPAVANYKGNFLAEFLEECHKQGIKVIGGIYFESPTTLKKHPDAVLIKKSGEKVPYQACFNNPEGQEYNLATIRHLVENYRVDGVVLDDNFELQNYECCCDYCKEAFRQYCVRQKIPYQDPSQISGGVMAQHWVQCKLEATRNLAAQVAKIAHAHNLPAGGWVGAGMGSTHLAQVFDFLGGMVYTEPPRAARLMLRALDKCKFITLLWAPSERPEWIEQEAREAVFAGSSMVGFWVYPPGHIGATGYDGWRMLEGSYEAIARAFAKVEEWWFQFYRDNILAGDARFTVVDGRVGKSEMTLRIKNTGKKVSSRIQGKLDLKAIMPSTLLSTLKSQIVLKERK